MNEKLTLSSLLRVTQVYCAIDDRLTSLKTDTFSKTREEKMEDLFAQKDVGVTWCFGPSHLCAGSFSFIMGLLCVKMEEAELRSWIEKLQGRLQACSLDSQQLQTVLESLVMKKQSLCEMLQYWNGRSGFLPASINGGKEECMYV